MSAQNGQDLFEMSRSKLEELCGKEEGARLDSQLNIQKNLSGVSIYIYRTQIWKSINLCFSRNQSEKQIHVFIEVFLVNLQYAAGKSQELEAILLRRKVVSDSKAEDGSNRDSYAADDVFN